MGCSAETVSKPGRKRAAASPRVKRANKPPKDYAGDPKYQAFVACGAVGDPADPKSMHIGQE